LSDAGVWIGVIIAAATLLVTYLSLRDRRRLEFAVVSTTDVVPAEAPAGLQVVLDNKPVIDAAIARIRLVNTGHEAILAADFHSVLTITFPSANSIATASATNTRPPNLNPHISLGANQIHISPLLINPGDMIEIQALTQGPATNISVEGRIANVPHIIRRRELPYPPGSGVEGEMLGFDRFMWFVVPPSLLAGLGVLGVIQSDTLARQIGFGVGFAILLALYFVVVRRLVRRRRLWRPW
jgi:hypothetical protein